MAWFIARNPDNLTQAFNDADGVTTSAGLINQGWTIYRIQPEANGRFTLVPQQVASGSEVTEQVLVSATLEDAP